MQSKIAICVDCRSEKNFAPKQEIRCCRSRFMQQSLGFRLKVAGLAILYDKNEAELSVGVAKQTYMIPCCWRP